MFALKAGTGTLILHEIICMTLCFGVGFKKISRPSTQTMCVSIEKLLCSIASPPPRLRRYVLTALCDFYPSLECHGIQNGLYEILIQNRCSNTLKSEEYEFSLAAQHSN